MLSAGPLYTGSGEIVPVSSQFGLLPIHSL